MLQWLSCTKLGRRDVQILYFVERCQRITRRPAPRMQCFLLWSLYPLLEVAPSKGLRRENSAKNRGVSYAVLLQIFKNAFLMFTFPAPTGPTTTTKSPDWACNEILVKHSSPPSLQPAVRWSTDIFGVTDRLPGLTPDEISKLPLVSRSSRSRNVYTYESDRG